MHFRTALRLCALMGTMAFAGACTTEQADETAYVPMDFRVFSGLQAEDFGQAIKQIQREDHIAAFYGDPSSRDAVLAFFEALGSPREATVAILDAARNYGVSSALAMALVHEESDFRVKAVNRNSDSVDRGLFQLNSLSFPKLGLEDFFDPETNARNGAAHLAYCLSQGGNDVAGLAMYNAGYGRVSKGGTPRRTLDYISRILTWRSNLEALFEAQVVARLGRNLASVTAPSDGFAAD